MFLRLINFSFLLYSFFHCHFHFHFHCSIFHLPAAHEDMICSIGTPGSLFGKKKCFLSFRYFLFYLKITFSFFVSLFFLPFSSVIFCVLNVFGCLVFRLFILFFILIYVFLSFLINF